MIPSFWTKDTRKYGSIFFFHEGLLCCVSVTPNYGHFCGYVRVLESSPFYKKDLYNGDYDSIDVHGGVTWSEPHLPWEKAEKADPGNWWVGFDTIHGFDDIANWDHESIIAETKRLAHELLTKECKTC